MLKSYDISPETIQNSKTYPYISPWGPKVINNFGKIIPVFKDMLHNLKVSLRNCKESCLIIIII